MRYIFLVICSFLPIVYHTYILVEEYQFIEFFFLLILGLVAVLVLYLGIAYMTVSIIRTETSIKGEYYTSRNREIRFDEIESVWINKIVNAIVIKDIHGTKIYIDMMLMDLQSILNDLYNKLDEEKTELVFAQLKKFYKGILLSSNLSELDAYKE